MARTKKSIVYLDTHIVAWAYDALLEKFSPRVTTIIENSDLLISPIVKLELQYLYEIGRLQAKADQICDALLSSIGLKTSDRTLGDIIAVALSQNWTRDPFDRLIVAEAILANCPLITKDRKILHQCSLAVW